MALLSYAALQHNSIDFASAKPYCASQQRDFRIAVGRGWSERGCRSAFQLPGPRSARDQIASS